MVDEVNTQKPANGEDTGTQTGADNKVQTKVQTFDDILSNKEYQAEFDRRVAKAIGTAKAKWGEDFEKQLEDKIEEANKLAKMTAEEKTRFKREKAEKELQSRIADVTKRELKATAKEQLSEEGLPTELAEALIYTDAESCKASMDAVKKAFNAAVSAAVNEKLKGSVPKGAKKKPDYDSMSDEEYYETKFKKQE